MIVYAARSAALYRRIWSPEGAPLLVTTIRQAEAIESALLGRLTGLRVTIAMRYGAPSIEDGIAALGGGVDRREVLGAAIERASQMPAPRNALVDAQHLTQFGQASAALARARPAPMYMGFRTKR